MPSIVPSVRIDHFRTDDASSRTRVYWLGERNGLDLWHSSLRLHCLGGTYELTLSSAPHCQLAIRSAGFVRCGIRQADDSQARREWFFAERRPTDSKSGKIVDRKSVV